MVTDTLEGFWAWLTHGRSPESLLALLFVLCVQLYLLHRCRHRAKPPAAVKAPASAPLLSHESPSASTDEADDVDGAGKSPDEVRDKKPDTQRPGGKSTPGRPDVPVADQAPLPVEQFLGESTDWAIIGASVIGHGHVSADLPCQDNHYYRRLDKHWSLLVVADGAGSADRSDLGSAWVARELIPSYLKRMLNDSDWFAASRLPSEESWWKLIAETLYLARRKLEERVETLEDTTSRDLACTTIIALISDAGILTAHVGDGRAAWRDHQGTWHPAITPFKGEEANQTVFLTSPIFDKQRIREFIETRVIHTETAATAVALMSDGVERAAFECSHIDTESGQWSDPNRPYPRFFEPLLSNVLKSLRTGQEDIDTNTRLQRFLAQGNETLAKESDDKTLVMAVRNSIN